MLIRRGSGEKVKRSGRQRVLVGAPVDVFTHQLLGRDVGHSADCHVGCSQSADIGRLTRYPEVCQQDSTFTVFRLGYQDVGRFNISVQ
jgi:hypothetical protein